jgi:hypothetical protein
LSFQYIYFIQPTFVPVEVCLHYPTRNTGMISISITEILAAYVMNGLYLCCIMPIGVEMGVS